MLLIAVAMMPLAALVVFGIESSYEQADTAARQTMVYEAEAAAQQFDAAFDQAKASLEILRWMPELQAADRTVCDVVLARIVPQTPLFLTLGVVGNDGTILCHSRTDQRLVFGDQDLIHRVLSPDNTGFLVGTFMIGPISHKPTVAVGLPMAITDGGAPRVVFASLNLDWLDALAARLSGPAEHTVALIDARTDRLLVRWPNLVPFGTPFPGHPLIKELKTHAGRGTLDSIGFDQIPRFFGFARVADVGGRHLDLAIGMPRNAAFASVQAQAAWAVSLALGAFVLAMSTAWWLASRTQLRPIGRLSAAAERLGAGDFSAASSHIDAWEAREFRRLGEVLDMTGARLALAQRADEAVAASERRYRLMAENTADMISCVGPDGTRSFVSGACREILGYEPDELLGRSPADIVLEADRLVVDALCLAVARRDPVLHFSYRVQRKDGRVITVEVGGRPIADDSGYVFTMRDVSERKAVEDRLAVANARLEALATTDDLTQLANRRRFDTELRAALSRSLREGSNLTLLLLDVDRFKTFNDHYGHPAGDACLRQVADTVRGCLRSQDDIAARYGGEEFAVILPGSSHTEVLSQAEAIRAAVRTCGIAHAGSEFGIVTVSIGVATLDASTDVALDDTALLRRADEALYRAKSAGRDRVWCGSPRRITA